MKGLEVSTIRCYRDSLSLPFKLAFQVDASSWEFKELLNCFFLEHPPRSFSCPDWDLGRVLSLLSSDLYSSLPLDKFRQLKKALFLFALAVGSRISEVHAVVRNGISVRNSGQAL